MDIITKRALSIRRATPDILRELFEMQNRICDLCGYPIQDLILAALDHSVPVIWFARLKMPIKDAIKQCNASSNMRATHAKCNSVKHETSREKWFSAKMFENVGVPKILTQEQMDELQRGVRERARSGGLIGGPLVAEKRLGVCGLSHTQHIAAGKKGGSISGPRNAENGVGFCSMSHEKHQELGHQAVKQGTGIHAAGYNKSICGRIGGRKCRDLGIGIFGRTAERRSKDVQKAGRVARDKRLGIHAFGMQSKGGCVGNHKRYHLARAISNPNCELCREETA